MSRTKKAEHGAGAHLLIAAVAIAALLTALYSQFSADPTYAVANRRYVETAFIEDALRYGADCAATMANAPAASCDGTTPIRLYRWDALQPVMVDAPATTWGKYALTARCKMSGASYDILVDATDAAGGIHRLLRRRGLRCPNF
jgi:hypothetical protein